MNMACEYFVSIMSELKFFIRGGGGGGEGGGGGGGPNDRKKIWYHF